MEKLEFDVREESVFKMLLEHQGLKKRNVIDSFDHDYLLKKSNFSIATLVEEIKSAVTKKDECEFLTIFLIAPLGRFELSGFQHMEKKQWFSKQRVHRKLTGFILIP